MRKFTLVLTEKCLTRGIMKIDSLFVGEEKLYTSQCIMVTWFLSKDIGEIMLIVVMEVDVVMVNNMSFMVK